jgi:hypothetical protein
MPVSKPTPWPDFIKPGVAAPAPLSWCAGCTRWKTKAAFINANGESRQRCHPCRKRFSATRALMTLANAPAERECTACGRTRAIDYYISANIGRRGKPRTLRTCYDCRLKDKRCRVYDESTRADGMPRSTDGPIPANQLPDECTSVTAYLAYLKPVSWALTQPWGRIADGFNVVRGDG